MIVVWYDVRKYHKETSVLSRFSPIWGNNHFVPGRADGGFKLWADRGLKQIKDIYNPEDGHFKTFEDLVSMYNIPHTSLNIYNSQVLLDPVRTIPTLATLEKNLIKNPFEKKIISAIYNLLSDN